MKHKKTRNSAITYEKFELLRTKEQTENMDDEHAQVLKLEVRIVIQNFHVCAVK